MSEQGPQDPGRPQQGGQPGQDPAWTPDPGSEPVYPDPTAPPPGYRPTEQLPDYSPLPPYGQQPRGLGQPPVYRGPGDETLAGYGTQPGYDTQRTQQFPAYGQASGYQPPYGQQPGHPPGYQNAYGPLPGYQPGYGDPQYGDPGWTSPGTPVPPGGPGGRGSHGGPGRGRGGLLAAAGIAVAVAVAVLTYFVFASGSSGASTPAQAVKGVLEAGRTLDSAKLRDSLCAADRGIAVFAATDRLKSYAIGATTTTGTDRASVHASITTTGGEQQDIDIPVVKENGHWRVCPSSGAGALPGLGGTSATPSASTPSATAPGGGPTFSLPTSIPSGLLPSGIPSGILPSNIPGALNFCASSSDALTPAEAYIGAAEVGLGPIAQTCVYHDVVPRSVADGLNGKLYAPDGEDRSGGNGKGPKGVYVFKSLDGNSTVTITTARQSDGKYYVTDVKVG